MTLQGASFGCRRLIRPLPVRSGDLATPEGVAEIRFVGSKAKTDLVKIVFGMWAWIVCRAEEVLHCPTLQNSFMELVDDKYPKKNDSVDLSAWGQCIVDLANQHGQHTVAAKVTIHPWGMSCLWRGRRSRAIRVDLYNDGFVRLLWRTGHGRSSRFLGWIKQVCEKADSWSDTLPSTVGFDL